jgi:isoleucyl-tRNA synthetase|tara:strand:- start:2428 stop:5283 length:2856 start_codon:yes stop_codon:yes gene_type:complete
MYDFKKTEKEILEFWKKNKTFEKSLEKTKKNKEYIFYDGPPFATGLPHYGHLLGSTMKDAIPRFWTMNKRHVKRVWGWDCHGLPVENIVEKELKIKTKDEIEKLGIKKFNNCCKSQVLTYVKEWKKVIERLARWVDMNNSYKTMDNNYIESVWWAFKKLFDKGLIYEGEKILMYCPRCETPLAKSEISMDNSYKTVKDLSITVKFKLKDEDVYVLIWTTTPWTLLSNLALAVNPKLTYVYVKDNSEGIVYLLAKELIPNYFKDKNEYKIIKEIKGREILGKEYIPILPYYENHKNAFKITKGNFVTAKEGTGIVHIAPYGEDDYNVLKENNIALVEAVNKQGKFTKQITDFSGEYLFDSNKKIIELLEKSNKIVSTRKIEHEYPFCYRCETPLIYMPIPSWFVNIQKIKPKILKLNKKWKWYPDFLREKRFKNSVESAPDWNISRNRFWATAIPIWKCDSCENLKVIGSIKELKRLAVNLPSGEIDLHKHFLDKVKLKCECEKSMSRIPEVLDCWFESGSMPFAQFHYPYENKKFFENNFPAQFVSEYIGQVRTWFYYSLVLSTILFEDIPFENVSVTGTILAEDGSKMSKSKKNFPDPLRIFEKYGSDSLRFYLLSSPVMNADDMNFSEKGVDETYKKVISLLYNVNNFYDIYQKKTDGKFSESKDITDKWIISRLNKAIKNITEYLKKYNTVKACSEIRNFVDDLSTWYVRINRERFNEDDINVRKTLRFVLENLSKVCAPLIPFVTEKIYQTLYSKNTSVHLQDWPKYNEKKIDSSLLTKMQIVRDIVSLGLAERDKVQRGLKWPLSKAVISTPHFTLNKDLQEIIAKQLNVKKIELKKGKEISVELDTKLTPELESEGYAREISRYIQSFRKKLGLKKIDKIKTILLVDYEFKKILEKQISFIEERTNSKKLEITQNVTTNKERFKNQNDFKVKDKRGKIVIITTNK